MGVEVDAQEKTWWVVPEGEAGEAGGRGPEARDDTDPSQEAARAGVTRVTSFAARVQAVPYSRSPNCRADLSRQDREQIEDLMSQRHAAKRRRAFQRADDLQLELRALGVETDDKAREWRIV